MSRGGDGIAHETDIMGNRVTRLREPTMWKQYTARSGEQLAKQKLSLKIELTDLGSRKHGSMATFEPGQQSK